MHTMARLTTALLFLTFATQAHSQWCWNALVTDWDGAQKCMSCRSAPGAQKYEPYFSIPCFYSCWVCNTQPTLANGQEAQCPTSVDDRPSPLDAIPSVNMAFADDLAGPIWNSIRETSPSHALFFLGLKHKYDAGYAVNVRDWHVAMLFMPTDRVIELLLADEDRLETIQSAAEPIARNQVVRVEARGRQLDNLTVELELTTVLETAFSPTERSTDLLHAATYLLRKVPSSKLESRTDSGEAAGAYVLASITEPVSKAASIAADP